MNRAFNSGEKFRELLRSKDFLVLAGAHSGLSAKIAERSGFDGIWASSFEMSALFGLPDSNILSFKDTYDLVKGMLYVTDIPVIVDCDNGYGNAVNVIRTVREYDSLGVAGICIEDNTFPKKCSFYNSKKRELESSKDFSNKISAAKDAQIDKSFFVIARTESFIAGLGLEEALSRADAYDAAGADAILVHSKSHNADEIESFSKNWNSKTPLVVVPTKFPQFSAEELAQKGFNVIIFANHSIRASIRAMSRNLSLLRKTGLQRSILEDISTLDEVFDLVDLKKHTSHEQQYL